MHASWKGTKDSDRPQTEVTKMTASVKQARPACWVNSHGVLAGCSLICKGVERIFRCGFRYPPKSMSQGTFANAQIYKFRSSLIHQLSADPRTCVHVYAINTSASRPDIHPLWFETLLLEDS